MKYFSIEEMTKSDTAKAKGIDNTPSKEVINNLIKLIEAVLDPLREWYGKPIYINSGYRCEALNKAVGGVSNSSHCFDRNTEILTNNGWRTYKTIKPYDKVLSMNLETQLLEFVDIDSIQIQPYKGNLIYADNKHVQFAVTDEHRMVVRTPCHKYVRKTDRVLTEAEQKYFDSLKTDNDKFHIELSKDIIGKRRIFKIAGISAHTNEYNVDILRMCMAVISDGFIQKKNGIGNPNIAFNLKKERDKQELEDILNKLGWKYNKYYSYAHEKCGREGVYHYYIGYSECAEIFEIIGLNKKIPRWFLTLKPEILRQLIITYAKFDGSFDKRDGNNGITIFSIDEHNIDMLQAMCVLCDMRCVKKEFKNYEINIENQHHTLKEFYHLYITQNTNESRMKEGSYHRFYYNSIVWCVNNRNTTLVTRRNGKVSIQGNCKGQAADITAGNRTKNKKLFDYIKDNLEFDQLIDEKNLSWVHVSFRENNNRKQVLYL